MMNFKQKKDFYLNKSIYKFVMKIKFLINVKKNIN